MNTKSITYALTGIILLVFFTAVPGLAQVNFASQKTYSFTGRNKLFASAYFNQYTAAGANYLKDIDNRPFPSSTPGDNNIAEEIRFIDKKEEAINFPFVNNEKRIDLLNMKIGFKRTSFTYPVNPGKDIGIARYSAGQLMMYAITLKQYARKNGFDTTYAFFSNMGMLNNKKRFFVVNLITMEIEQSGLVAQGRGLGPTRFDKQYSNTKDSKCTSLGRYKIIKKYKGEYGAAYRMLGLDSSNCNAFKRNIVLHSMGCMPDEEEDNIPVCISEGCPAVSIKFLSSLSGIIDSRKRPVLLWIFDSNLEEIVVQQKPVGTKMQEMGCDEETSYHSCSIHQPENSNAE